jgi:hypothetical protein
MHGSKTVLNLSAGPTSCITSSASVSSVIYSFSASISAVVTKRLSGLEFTFERIRFLDPNAGKYPPFPTYGRILNNLTADMT